MRPQPRSIGRPSRRIAIERAARACIEAIEPRLLLSATDLSVQNTGPASATAGTAITYTVTVTNNGPDDAQSVSLSDPVPANETFASVTAPAGWTRTDSTPAGGTGTLTFTNPTLASGASGTFFIVEQVASSAAKASTLSNIATVSTATTDTNNTNDSSTATSTVDTAADISVVKTGPATAIAGNDITYTITIHNAGPSDSPAEGLSDGLTGDVSNTNLTLVSGPDLLSTLPAGGTTVFSFTAHVNSKAADASQVVNTVDISGVITDPNPLNNESVVTTTISTEADVSVVTTGPATIIAGQSITYNITVTNNGPSDAQGVLLSDTLPPGTSAVSFMQDSGPNNGSTLPVGGVETFTLLITTNPMAAEGTMLVNTANVTTTTFDPDIVNNSSSVTTTIADSPLIGAPAAALLATEGAATGPVTVATFIDTFPNPAGDPNGAADFTAMITWGDGQTSAGTITQSATNPNFYTVTGTNTYAEEGLYPVSVHVADAGGSTTDVTDQALVVDAPLTANPGVNFNAIEGQKLSGQVVATFTDADPNGMLGDYLANIQWGDGTASAATFAPAGVGVNGNPIFNVIGNHTYHEEGSYNVIVAIQDAGAGTFSSETAIVSDPAVVGTAVAAFSAKKGVNTGTITVANFTDPGGAEPTTDYSATIDWGDGTSPTAGTIVLSNGKLSVTGAHTFNSAGTFHPTIVIHHDAAPDSNIVTDTVNVPAYSLTTTGVNISGIEGRSVTAKAASFVSGNAASSIGNFTASINWGDGTASTGTIVKDSAGHFHVNGTHVYHEESTGSGYKVTTTIREYGGNTVVATSLANIADAPLDTPAGLTLSKSANVAFTNLVLGSFRDQDATNTTPTDYTGTITWGDGTTSAASFVFKSATANIGSFWSVTGSHKYTTKKTFAVKIVLHDNASPTKTITINTTIKAV
ncbi:MAG TPA: LEPR-XLL domain-containing protein [Tepidisphaeraceae bacterium]|jgi:uncharacterized repeat protein (TIGR01451 family)|nr:LEPR-XLL domain-containing protein [Tepidisphaeraceae bacterium]